MSIQKAKQKVSNFIVKAILASYIVIVGEYANKNKDVIAFISNKDLFEKIVLSGDYDLDRDYIHEIISMQKINLYTKRRIERIFNIIDSDLSLSNEIPETNLNLIKEFIITKVTLQQIEHNIFLDKKVREIIQKERPITFIRLYFYLTGHLDLFDVLNINKREDVDILFKVLLKAYEILRELNPDQPKKVTEIVYRLKSILESPEKIDLKIDIGLLDLIKIPMELRELNEEKKKLESNLNIIKEKLEYRKEMETIPGELKKDPEVRKLIENKKEIEKRLKEIENRIKELREKWNRLISNNQN